MAPAAQTKGITDTKTTRKKVSPPNKFPQAPTLLNKFSEPARLQAASPLLRLSGELRVKIFRYLLKDDTAILDWGEVFQKVNRTCTRHNGESWGDFDNRQAQTRSETFMFSGQILACCQQTYQEGRHILYKENSVVFRFTQAGLWVVNLEVKFCEDRREQFWSLMLNSPADKDLFLRGKCNIRGLQVQGQQNFSSALKRDVLEVYPAIASFDHISIISRPETQELLFAQCRALQSLLEGKKISLVVQKELDSSPVPNTWLASCRILRCKDISILSHTGSKMDQVRSIIVSDDIVEEEYASMRYAQHVLDRTCGNKGMTTRTMRREYRTLKLAFLKGNKRLVIDHKEKFKKAAEEAIESWRLRELEAIKQQKAETEDTRKRMIEMITESP